MVWLASATARLAVRLARLAARSTKPYGWIGKPCGYIPPLGHPATANHKKHIFHYIINALQKKFFGNNIGVVQSIVCHVERSEPLGRRPKASALDVKP